MVNLVFDNYETVYGKSHKVPIIVDADKPTPIITISESRIQVFIMVNIRMKNPLNT